MRVGFVTSLVYGFVQRQTRASTNRNRTLSIFVGFFQFRLNITNVPSRRGVAIFRGTRFLNGYFYSRRLVSVLNPTSDFNGETVRPFFVNYFLRRSFYPVTNGFSIFLGKFRTLSRTSKINRRHRQDITTLHHRLTEQRLRVFSYGSRLARFFSFLQRLSLRVYRRVRHFQRKGFHVLRTTTRGIRLVANNVPRVHLTRIALMRFHFIGFCALRVHRLRLTFNGRKTSSLISI